MQFTLVGGAAVEVPGALTASASHIRCSRSAEGESISVRSTHMALRKLSIMIAAVLAVVGSLTIVTPANAANPFEFDQATPSTMNGCIIFETVVGCGDFMPQGDYFRITDTLPDGHSAAIYWHNYLASAPNTLYRWGSCVNSLGDGKKGQCNKNFQEGSTIEYKVCAYERGTVPSNVNNYFECGRVWRTTA
jgi:hypothetical protein